MGFWSRNGFAIVPDIIQEEVPLAHWAWQIKPPRQKYYENDLTKV